MMHHCCQLEARLELLATLRRAGGLESVARQANVPPASVMACAEAFLPVLVSGLRERVAAGGGGDAGLAVVLAQIDECGDGNLAVLVMGQDKVDTSANRALLTRFVGPEAMWRVFCADCATACRLEHDVVLDVIVLLTMLTCGYLSARSHGTGAGHGDMAVELGPLYGMLTAAPGEGPDFV